jgi:hypothetical protein
MAVVPAPCAGTTAKFTTYGNGPRVRDLDGRPASFRNLGQQMMFRRTLSSLCFPGSATQD